MVLTALFTPLSLKLLLWPYVWIAAAWIERNAALVAIELQKSSTNTFFVHQRGETIFAAVHLLDANDMDA